MAAVVVVGAAFPALQPRFWSWDWYWVDLCARDQCRWGGPFYDIAHHANPLPFEVQWYRMTLAVLGQRPTAHHVLALVGLLATLAVLHQVVRAVGVPEWASGTAVVLAGVSPAALTSWTWFAASPHLWAALLGLGAAGLHLRWRASGSRSWLIPAGALALAVLGLAMKNDAVIGPLLVVAWEWLSPMGGPRPGRRAVTVAATVPVAVFVWWQFTAVDPHRDQARTGLTDVLGNAVGLLRFTFLWRNESELRAEFPPGASAPLPLTVAGFLVGGMVLALAAVSLRRPEGRVLVIAGLGSLAPIAVLQPALVSRYVLPPTLLITAAAGAGAGYLLRTRSRNQTSQALDRPDRETISAPRITIPVAIGIGAILSWAALTWLTSGAGYGAGQEEDALLAGFATSTLTPADIATVELVNSPLEPSTAEFRQLDPTLAPRQRLRRLTFLLPGEEPPADGLHAVAVRHPSGDYQITANR